MPGAVVVSAGSLSVLVCAAHHDVLKATGRIVLTTVSRPA